MSKKAVAALTSWSPMRISCLHLLEYRQNSVPRRGKAAPSDLADARLAVLAGVRCKLPLARLAGCAVVEPIGIEPMT